MQKSRLKIAKAKDVLITIINNISSIKVDNPSQYSDILALTGIYKKVFCFSAVVITYNKNRSEKPIVLSQK